MLPRPRPTRRLDFAFSTVNVVLLLLFFFVVSGSILGPNEVGVAPPVVVNAPPERLPRPLLVVDRNGALFLDDTLVGVGEIGGRLRARGDRAPLNVIADRNFAAARFLAIVEAVRRQGVSVRLVALDAQSVGVP